ncbi:deoxyribodipyrimidine photo-lyase [Pedobacter psychrotolerans]|uniref:Cryptochrome DASH n=1 Tax=Pedobacter psychrotolerans TaxID=1843235 RepID=A0A4R2HD90_9SPHI|nr:DASH family cryptochrome [Pedobacter psychrotolerans]TCO23661.1 deoxyribodipyrimidine photo-lyase [Pedobacter psychrotolerans]GGE61642.1 cryptochrome DASH [Pedobacter psychrotolerans]
MSKKILVWFRNDLRLHDNELLVEAIAKSDSILPVYILDPRQFGVTKYGTLKTGSIRAHFLLESVLGLRAALKQIGGNLLIATGSPEEIIPQLIQEYEITEVYHHREVAREETHVSTLVENALWKLRINLKHFIGHTLYNKEDLPFPIKDIPDAFNQFKKKIERDSIIKPCFPSPDRINVAEVIDWGTLPTLEELGLLHQQKDQRSDFEFEGGEAEGLVHLQKVIVAMQQAATSKNLILVSKLSAWLAMGCLSPRKVYWEIKKIEGMPNTKAMFNHILLGLLWRDYFRFMFKKYGNTFFNPNGFGSQGLVDIENEQENFNKWRTGQTGFAVVDAVMTELNQTGFISNIARQTTALYLVNNLEVSWVFGAAYFEEKLIDYNPASNWGNWANIAGVGNDQKSKGVIDMDKNIKNLDPKGNYALTWASE